MGIGGRKRALVWRVRQMGLARFSRELMDKHTVPETLLQIVKMFSLSSDPELPKLPGLPRRLMPSLPAKLIMHSDLQIAEVPFMSERFHHPMMGLLMLSQLID